MTTAQDQQSRAAYEDGKWYWVEHEGWHGQAPIIAPACYKAECDAWYSYVFSGISTRFLKVLEPCERQAARALPAPEPVAKIHNGTLTWNIPWPEYSVDTALLTGTHDLFTAAQVQAMGRVPPGWQAVPVEPTQDMIAAGRNYTTLAAGAYRAMCAAAPRPPAAQDSLIPPGYIAGIQTDKCVTLSFKTQDDASAWFDKFMDAYDAANQPTGD